MTVRAESSRRNRPFTPDDIYPTNVNEPYLAWLQYVLAQEQLPYVISTSYGDDEQTVPISYAMQVCNDLAKLTARGVTLVFASSDSGATLCPVCNDFSCKSVTSFPYNNIWSSRRIIRAIRPLSNFNLSFLPLAPLSPASAVLQVSHRSTWHDGLKLDQEPPRVVASGRPSLQRVVRAVIADASLVLREATTFPVRSIKTPLLEDTWRPLATCTADAVGLVAARSQRKVG